MALLRPLRIFQPRSVLLRLASSDALTDRWTNAHKTQSSQDRRWPRPRSPMAAFEDENIDYSKAEEEEIALASKYRLPPVDEAESFDAYVQEVAGLVLEQKSDTAVGLQIKEEAAAARLMRGHRARPMTRDLPPLPRPHEIDVDEAAALDRLVLDRVGEQLAQPLPSAGDAAALAAALQQQPQQQTPPPPAAAAAKPVTGGPRREGASTAAALRDAISGFDLTPRRVKAHLDEHVIAQETAKRALSVAVCDHYNFARQCIGSPEMAETHHVKPNVLLLGPSGVGKTHLMRALAKLLGVPFAKGDATKFSATGYVGGDVDDLVRSLVPAAGGDVPLAEYGIVYVDEVDKLADGPERKGLLGGGGSGVNTKDVQCALLKLMEDAEIPLQQPNTPQPRGLPATAAYKAQQKQPSVLRTRHVLFVFSGAFTGLEGTLRKQHESSTDKSALDTASLLKQSAEGGGPMKDVLHLAGTSDLVRSGLEPEFVGRIPVRVACRHLSADDLLCVLRDAKDSVASQLVRDFAGYGITLTLTECALREVANRAVAERTGARGLLTVLEETLRDYKFELPGSGITELEVDAEVVREPKARLEKLLLEGQN